MRTRLVAVLLAMSVLLQVGMFRPQSDVCGYSAIDQATCDWASFGKNPEGNRVADGCGPKIDDIKQLWQFETESRIWSSPVVVDGKAYIRTETNMLYSVDVNTGKEKWQLFLGSAQSGTIPNSPSTACVQNGKIYIGSFDGKLHCIEATKGKQVWEFATGGIIWSSPTIFDGKLYFGSDDKKFYCLDPETGKVLWTFATNDKVWGSATFFEDDLFIGSNDNYIYNLDRKTGDKGWTLMAGKNNDIEGMAVVADGKLYIGTYGGKVFCLDAKTGMPKWFKDGFIKISGSMLVYKGKVYIPTCANKTTNARIVCLDAKTGNFIWDKATKNKDKYVGSSPVGFDDKVCFTGIDDKLYILDAASGKELWSYQIPETFPNTFPVVADGKILLSSFNKVLYCFGNAKQKDPPVPANIVITPTSGSIDICMTAKFEAKVFDQYSKPMENVALEWGVEDASVGTVSPDGIFTPKSFGKTMITCKAGNVVKSAEINVFPFIEADRKTIEITDTLPDKNYEQKLTYLNKSFIDLEVSLEWNSPKLAVYPARLTIPASGSQMVTISYTTKDFRVGAKDNFAISAKYLDCTLETPVIVAGSSSIPCIKASLSSLNFGLIHRGDQKTITLALTASAKTDVTITSADPWIYFSKNRFTLDGNPNEIKFTIMASALPASSKLTTEIKIKPDKDSCSLLAIPVMVETEDKIVLKLQVGNNIATINGIQRTLTKSPIIDKGRVMVPLRFVSEVFGCQLEWNADEKKITVSRYDVSFMLWVDKKIAYINGKEVPIDAPPINVKGNVMVPLRFIAEPFGAKVDWNAETKEITITWPKS